MQPLKIRTVPLAVATAIAFMFFQGCTSNNKNNVLSELDTIYAKVDTISVLSECFYPTRIVKAGQHFVVHDLGNPASALVAYDMEGNLEFHFANKGHATNEVEFTAGFHKIDGNKIAIYKQGGILTFDMDSVDERGHGGYSFRKMPVLPYSVQDASVAAGGFVTSVVSDSVRFCLAESNGNTHTYGKCPEDFVDSEQDRLAVTNYASRLRVSPDGKRFCQGTYIGAMLETFAIEDDAIVPTGTNILYKSEYKKMDNEAVSWDEKTTIGFDDICACEKQIYTILNQNKGQVLIDGGANPFGQSITVFDWNAQPQKVIHVGVPMMCLCVEEQNNEAYAIQFDSSGLYLLHLTW